MKLFISSLIGGYGEERAAVAHAAEVLRWDVLRAEDFGARPDTPEQACLEAARLADVVVLILGARYGATQESGLSATHEEWREAVQVHKPVLVFVEDVPERDDDQVLFVNEVQDWAGGRFRETFRSSDELADKVTRALADLAGPGLSDEIEMRARALAAIPEEQIGLYGRGPMLWVAVAGGPRQQILRPAEIEAPQLIDDLQQAAMFGAAGPLDSHAATQTLLEGNRLRIGQDNAEMTVAEDGTVTICIAAATADLGPSGVMPSIIEEDIQHRLADTLRFAHTVLHRIDPIHRLTDVVTVAALRDATFAPWRTRAEATANPNTVNLPVNRSDEQPVTRTPSMVRRAALIHETDRLAEDLTVLLRRQRG